MVNIGNVMGVNVTLVEGKGHPHDRSQKKAPKMQRFKLVKY